MPEPATPRPTARDAERSKAAILEAATQLFAAKGFDATSIADIAEAAGVARGTPAYFFGSKENLFDEAVDRVHQRALEIVPNALARAGTQPTRQELIAAFVDTFLDFHEANPEFLRLIHWISLGGNRLVPQAVSFWGTIADMLRAVMMTLQGTALEHDDPRQMVLSIVGMCSAHVAYAHTLAEPLGLHPKAPGFLEARKTHLKKLFAALVAGAEERKPVRRKTRSKP